MPVSVPVSVSVPVPVPVRSGLAIWEREAVFPRLLLDPGHGDVRNPGNTNLRCEEEAVVMLGLAKRLVPELALRGVSGELTRVGAQKDYNERVRMAADFSVLVSLHSDARAGSGLVRGRWGCLETTGAAGMAVLFSDEGEAGLVGQRRELARAIARRAVDAGFSMYGGQDYGGLYEGDLVRGVFVDRHLPKKRVKLLRRPVVPSVIVETHDAHVSEDVSLWEKADTVRSFAGVLAVALGDVAQP